MDISLLMWAIFALIVFWCIGLYNRLMRLRARAIEVLSALERHVLACADLVSKHLTTGALLGAAEVDPEWLDVLVASQELGNMLRAPHSSTLDEAAIVPVSAGWSALQAAWQVAVDRQSDLAGPVVPPDLALAWEAAVLKVSVVHGGYAQIVDRYNESIAEFPARLVTGFLGFTLAGRFSL
jgi:LemA protein